MLLIIIACIIVFIIVFAIIVTIINTSSKNKNLMNDIYKTSFQQDYIAYN